MTIETYDLIAGLRVHDIVFVKGCAGREIMILTDRAHSENGFY